MRLAGLDAAQSLARLWPADTCACIHAPSNSGGTATGLCINHPHRAMHLCMQAQKCHALAGPTATQRLMARRGATQPVCLCACLLV